MIRLIENRSFHTVWYFAGYSVMPRSALGAMMVSTCGGFRFFRTFGAKRSRSYTPRLSLDRDSFYPAYKTRALSKSNFARPYIWRLSNFNRLT